MPGIELEMDGAMQHAPQLGRQSMILHCLQLLRVFR